VIRHLLAGAAMLLALAAPPRLAGAGEVVECFAQGRLGLCSEPVLQHVGFKSVVLQFVDPRDTDLGEGLSRLLWREILESISDLAGAGVILAYDRQGAIRSALGDRDYQEFLAREYHAAAERIAASLGVQMSIWGVVLPDGEDLYLQGFLTLHVQDAATWTSLSVGSAGGGTPGGRPFTAAIGPQRLNLAPRRASRQALFNRAWTTRCALSAGCPGGVELRAGASNDAPVVARVPEGIALRGRDMVRQWLKVVRPDGGEAYINLYHVEMFPDRVTFAGRRAVNLRGSAGSGGTAVGRVDLDGTYPVLGAVRAARAEPWYRISAGGREGWVAGRLVERRSYTFPAVHLVAGLYRYARGQFPLAAAELEAFLADARDEDNVTQSVARQFLAASRVAGRAGPAALAAALRDLDEAVELTPFDPAAYAMRALVNLGAHDVVATVADIDRALALDRRDPEAQRLLADVLATARGPGLRRLAPGRDVGPAERQLHRLGERYPSR